MRMKNKVISLIVFALASGNLSSAQTNWEEYYPLHIGDFWEYLDFGTVPMTLTRKVIADTLMPNGKTYKVIEEFYRDGPHPGRSGPLQYERIDSVGNVFAYIPIGCKWPLVWADTLIYKLSGAVGDTIQAICRLPDSHWRLIKKDTTVLFGQRRQYAQFYLFKDVVRGDKTIVQGIGLVDYGYEGGDRTLRGAIISGKRYGDITVGIQEQTHGDVIPIAIELLQNYPNPFNSTTSITYRIYQSGPTQVSIYSIDGIKLRVLFDGQQFPGKYSLRWDGTDEKGRLLSSGVYFIQLFFRDSFMTRKALYIK